MHKAENMKLSIALFLLLLVASCQAKTLIVDPGESGDAETLLAAILLAGNGDTIQILPGNYGGAIVDKSVNISGTGAVIIEGSLAVTAPGCMVSDITIKARGKDAGISLASPNNQLVRCTVEGIATAVKVTGENNSIRDCRIDSPQGVEIFGAKNEVLRSNISGSTAIRINGTWGGMVSGCQISALHGGVQIEDSWGNTVVNNTFSGNGFGVVLTRSHGNDVSYNNLSRGYVSGLDVVDSRSSNLTKNYITGGKVGISLRGSQNCNISGNICEKNERAGIFAEGADHNLLVSNNLSENGNGILLQGSMENTLISNQAYRNVYGISLRGGTKNMLRENVLLENSYNLRVDSGQGRSGSSNHDFFVQDIDQSNLLDNKPICYLVGKADLMVPEDIGFLGLVSCKNISASNLTLKNSSTGVLLVNSTNCNIQNSSVSWAETGFLIQDSQACTISHSQSVNCNTGFLVEASSGCQFAYDRARNCSAIGFRADNAQGLSLLGCEIQFCQSGIALHESRLCRIQNCSTSKNQGEGVLLSKSHNCSLIGNAAFSNDRGISLTGSNSCFLQANNASENKLDGISLQQLSNVNVQNNIALRNGQGIYVQSSRLLNLSGNILGENNRFGLRMSSSKDCNISENNIYDNRIVGANLVDCARLLLYHNVFEKNGIQNAADNGQNQWDGGPRAGGNYWSDHSVYGNPADVPRQIPGGGVDHYPFQDSWGWQ
jgi:parallel beta-helix repeat protein